MIIIMPRKKFLLVCSCVGFLSRGEAACIPIHWGENDG